jgi:hypothetical protein
MEFSILCVEGEPQLFRNGPPTLSVLKLCLHWSKLSSAGTPIQWAASAGSRSTFVAQVRPGQAGPSARLSPGWKLAAN